MKTAICYYSRHHGNTLKVLAAMAQEGEIDLIDVTTRQTVRLEEYDCIGFASSIYGFEFQKAVVEFARQYLPQGKPVFFVYTYSGAKGNGAKALAEIATSFGQTLSWKYLCWVREHPLSDWTCHVHILYGSGDNMTPRQTVEEYACHHDAQLTVMEGGEHWFHTPEQLAVLRKWEEKST